MKPNYRAFFALTREPFGPDLTPKEIMQTAEILGVVKRLKYAIRLGALALVTGDVGSGKSTTLRWAASRRRPHPSIRSSGSSPHRAPSWNSIGKSASSSNWIPPASPGPSSPNSSQKTGPGNRPGPQEETRLHHRGSLHLQASSSSRVEHHHSVSGRLQANLALHPGRPEQPCRPPHNTKPYCP
ncbi:hypothetical protein DFAR_970018 [Desulfarculales bacterium]